MASQLEASTWTALTTGTQIREALDAKRAHNMTSSHLLPIGKVPVLWDCRMGSTGKSTLPDFTLETCEVKSIA